MTTPSPQSATIAELRSYLPPRKPAAHKGDFGHVLVIAGSRGMTGAAVLAARAALRSGAGLVTLAVPWSQQPIVAAHLVEAQTLALPESSHGVLRPESAAWIAKLHQERWYSVLAIGPGLSMHPETGKAVALVLENLRIPTVVDADGLNTLSVEPGASKELVRRRKAPCVVTPHPGEMARLLGISAAEVQADRIHMARKFAEDWGVVCLLKGHDTVIADGERLRINPSGNSGLAKGGSGDALTGIIAGLWSQRLGLGRGGAQVVHHSLRPCELAASRGADRGDNGFEAAVLGAYIHGLSADIAAHDKTKYCLLASDVIEGLPAAFKRLDRN